MQNKLTRPKAADWLAIKCLVEILAPFASVSTMLGGQSYPTLPLVLPALRGLRKRLLTESLFAEHENLVGGEMYVDDTMVTVKECRDAVVRLFDARFEKLERTELLWVPLLDPRVAKWMGYLHDKEKKKLARLKLIEALVDLVRAEPPPTLADQIPSERAFSTSGNIVTVKRASLAPELARDLVFITENMRRQNYSSGM
eukprot:jgi/Phyca11/98522/e_gw1.3.1057.1